MTTPTAFTTNASMSMFTLVEQQVLLALRDRYGQDRDMFNDSERTRLRFIRWLYRTGRLVR